MLALIEGNSWGWGSPAVVGLFVGGAAGLAAFVAIELRVRAPMVQFSFFANRNFLGANAVAFIISFGMLGTFFFMAIYMQDLLGYSALEAGVRFLPTTVLIVVIAPLAGRLADRIGPMRPIVAGLGILAVSLFMFSRIGVTTTYDDLLLPFVLMGIGIALTMSPMSTAAMNAVTQNKAGIASGILQMSRMIGGSVGVAATGAIFQAQMGGFDPSALAAGGASARVDFVGALGSAMGVSAAIVVAGALIAVATIRGSRRDQAGDQPGDPVAELAGVEPAAPIPGAPAPRPNASRPSRLAPGPGDGGPPQGVDSDRRPRGGFAELDPPEGLDGHPAEAFDRDPVRDLDSRGPRRPWRHHHGRHLEAGPPHRLEGEQGVVDRAEARARRDHDREPEVAGEVADQVIVGQRHEEAPTPSATSTSPCAAAARARARRWSGSIGSPRSSAPRCGETGGP